MIKTLEHIVVDTRPSSKKPRAAAINARDAAILRHIWHLNSEEQRVLDRYFLMSMSYADFYKNIDFNGKIADYYVKDRIKYEIVMLQCDYNILEETKLVQLSMRQNFASEFNIALVRPDTRTRK